MPPTNGAVAKVLPILNQHAGEMLTVEQLMHHSSLTLATAQAAMRRIVKGELFPTQVLAQGKVWKLGTHTTARPERVRPPRDRTVRPLATGADPWAARVIDELDDDGPEPTPAKPALDRKGGPGRIPDAHRYTVVADYGINRLLRDNDGYLWAARRVGLAD